MTDTKKLIAAGNALCRALNHRLETDAYYGCERDDHYKHIEIADAWRALVASLEDSHNAAVRQEK